MTVRTYEPPEIVDLGPIAAHTFATPPGCDPAIPLVKNGGCNGSHKGFTNLNTPDGSDAELSSSDGGPQNSPNFNPGGPPWGGRP